MLAIITICSTCIVVVADSRAIDKCTNKRCHQSNRTMTSTQNDLITPLTSKDEQISSSLGSPGICLKQKLIHHTDPRRYCSSNCVLCWVQKAHSSQGQFKLLGHGAFQAWFTEVSRAARFARSPEVWNCLYQCINR